MHFDAVRIVTINIKGLLSARHIAFIICAYMPTYLLIFKPRIRKLCKHTIHHITSRKCETTHSNC